MIVCLPCEGPFHTGTLLPQLEVISSASMGKQYEGGSSGKVIKRACVCKGAYNLYPFTVQ